MKIVIATAVYYPQINGVAVFSHNLAVGLARRGHEVMVLCPSQTGKSYRRTVDGVLTVYLRSVEAKVYPDQIHTVPKKRRVCGVTLPRLFYKHGFRVSVWPAGEVRNALDDFRPDVVHVQVSDPIGLSVVSWARKHLVPVVTTEHNQPEVLTEPLHVPGVVRKGANAVLSAYFRNRQSKSDFVTMPTERAIRDLIGSGEEFKVPVAAVSNGVDLKNFRPGRGTEGAYSWYGLDSKRLTLLYVGRLDPEKKVGIVIKAFLKARKDISNAQLVIVGDGVDKARLMKMAEGCKEICFLGRVMPPELYTVYQLGDIFVTASPIETQGIVLIEAAACGLPLIAVDKGAVAEVCRNEVNGYLCRPGSVDEVARAMVVILSDEDLRQRFSEASVVIAGEHDFEKTLDKFINIYNKVIEMKRGGRSIVGGGELKKMGKKKRTP